MNPTGRTLVIFALMAVGTTMAGLGTSITFAAPKAHTQFQIQLMSRDYFPTLAAPNTHLHHHQQMDGSASADDISTIRAGSFGPTQFAATNWPYAAPGGHLGQHHR